MPNKLRILFVASESVPFCKTGGLADVVGALPRVLHERGHDVRVILPRYRSIDQAKFRLLPLLPEMKVSYGSEVFSGSILRCSFPGTNMPVYFIDEPHFFDREGIYGGPNGDYLDNGVRFAFFNMATLWTLKALDWQPDVIHLNDWQTGLIPALLRHHPVVSTDPHYAETKTLFAVHNLAYQGNFDKYVIPQIGLPWSVYTQEGMEFYDKASFLKSGLAFADRLVTVSPTYAREIQGEEHGAGMDGILRHRSGDLAGIMNGIDVQEWDPTADPHIAASFSAEDIAQKKACKAELQKAAGLKVDPTIPLVAMVSRLVDAKGFDLVSESLQELLALDAQFFILGTGKPEYEELYRQAAATHGDRFAAHIGYDVPLSHKAIAGADIFLMPSEYEPCGLTQLYSMRYGTVPVAHATGGLVDSIVAVTKGTLKQQKATGFLFDKHTSDAMLASLREALALYRKGGEAWASIQRAAMAQDTSWDRSAGEYERLYRELVRSKKGT